MKTLVITDAENKLELEIEQDTVKSSGFEKWGLSIYDNGYLNTAVCRSQISYIDGDRGILRYRGYDIEDLAEHSNFLEVSYLLLYGELPSFEQQEVWTARVLRHTYSNILFLLMDSS